MGVDVDIHRCRIGLFVAGRDTGVILTSFITSFSKLVKVIGSVAFITILLLMAGVEPNPGPDKLIFRYQYLLIEVGTQVIRGLFDHLVGNDFMHYLNTNTKQYKQLQKLINNKILTAEQAKFLPPIDKTPNTSNFDITLLTCLLRNVCGLCDQKNPVWKNPAPGDLSVEADIARFRLCRNDIQHMSTVRVSESEFQSKWNELTSILNRLNAVCGLTNLTTLIHDAEHKEIDDELKKRLDKTLKEWADIELLFDRGFEELKLGQSDLKQGQSDLKQGQSDIKKGQSDIKKGQSDLKQGQSDIKQGQSDIKEGQSDLKKGQSDIKEGQSDLKQGQSDIKKGQSDLKQGQSDIKRGMEEGINLQREIRDKVEILCERKRYAEQEPSEKRFNADLSHSDVKECLKKRYLETCDKLQVSPLFNEDDEMDLLTIYQPPNMCHLPYHRDRETEEKYPISSYEDVFTKSGEFLRNIYITGDAGVGKTSFCSNMCHLPYQRDKETEGKYPISSYEDVFTKDGKSFRNIYITGDAGVGKTSFCQRMALLWSKSQSDDTIDNEDVQRDIDFMRKFDFVFYVSLRDTRHTSIVKMIMDTFLSTDSKDIMEERVKLIENILCEKQCLIILDGFDEWTPSISGNETCRLPRKIKSETCTYITSCRPYKIESVRLEKKEIDHQIQITGICEKSTEEYIEKMVSYVNKVNKDNKKPEDFLSEVRECRLDEQLHIPIIASQLVVLWFNKRLTDMSRALTYGNIVEMLLEKAVEDKKLKLTPAKCDEIKLPESFEELTYLQQYASLLEKVCSLSFKSLFQLDKTAAGLVFTKKQLMCYSITPEEINTLCKIGILSKNKVIGSFARQELKISFIHKSYTEFLAALFVYSFDKNNLLDTIVNTWSSMKDVVQYENFFTLLSGISYEKVKCLLENIYPKISLELAIEMNYFLNTGKINFYQNFVLSCFKEACISKTTNIVLKLEHFLFEKRVVNDTLFKLLLLNKTCVKSILISNLPKLSKVRYIDIFNCIKDSQLEHLHISFLYDNLDNNTMKTLTSTLKSLPCIKSLTLRYMKLPDDVLLQLHPHVTRVEILLYRVTMSRQWFHCFIESIKNKSEIEVTLEMCNITSVDEETRRKLSVESVIGVYEYLKSIPTINITHKDDFSLNFKTTSGQ